MAEFTKGPWSEDRGSRVPATYGVSGPGGKVVVRWGGIGAPQSTEGQANARLIAAAPDLVEALLAAERFIANGIEFGFIRMPDPGTPDRAHEMPGMIRAALSRAGA